MHSGALYGGRGPVIIIFQYFAKFQGIDFLLGSSAL